MNVYRRALVIGLGRTGLATTEVLRERGADVYATDEAGGNLLEQIAQVRALGARFVEPATVGALLRDLDVAVLSPGVPLRGALAQRVVAAGVPVISEVELAARLCAAPIVAITGTKGKSTTTALTAHLMEHAGLRVRVGGNIGNALIREAVRARADEWVVAEISSFQLESIVNFKPRISVLLNISPDHLDRYAGIEEYAAAKYRIFENQSADDLFIGNLQDARVAALRVSPELHARALWFSSRPHDGVTLWAQDGEIRYAREGAAPQSVLAISEIALPGDHNVENVLAAVLAVLAAGVEPQRLRGGVASFSGMAHRLQTVALTGGVRFVDDSKATNPAATIAALRSFAAPVVLIAGGKSKRTDFAQLGSAIRERAKAVVALGEAADEIAAAAAGVPVRRAATMEHAVSTAAALCVPGDVVLLSPACASFDMFDSAEDRGEQFTLAARNLREPAGA